MTPRSDAPKPHTPDVAPATAQPGAPSALGGSRVPFLHFALVGILVAMVTGCATRQIGAAPNVPPASYLALPDTLVCVIDRSAALGLREIPAKVGATGVVLFADGEVQALETVHPTNVIAGYAGREPWLARGDPIQFEGRRFVRYLGERRIGPGLLRRAGEHQGILLFAGADAASPLEVLYVPTAPGCIFQPFAREDIVNR